MKEIEIDLEEEDLKRLQEISIEKKISLNELMVQILTEKMNSVEEEASQ